MSATRGERGSHAPYAEDPDGADWLLFGRRPHADRRGFLSGAKLASMGVVLGATVPFHRSMPAGLVPVALAQTDETFLLQANDGLTVLKDRPINAQTPAHLLDDGVAPITRHFSP